MLFLFYASPFLHEFHTNNATFYPKWLYELAVNLSTFLEFP